MNTNGVRGREEISAYQTKYPDESLLESAGAFPLKVGGLK